VKIYHLCLLGRQSLGGVAHHGRFWRGWRKQIVLFKVRKFVFVPLRDRWVDELGWACARGFMANNLEPAMRSRHAECAHVIWDVVFLSIAFLCLSLFILAGNDSSDHDFEKKKSCLFETCVFVGCDDALEYQTRERVCLETGQ
jgi:hypothetical protein